MPGNIDSAETWLPNFYIISLLASCAEGTAPKSSYSLIMQKRLRNPNNTYLFSLSLFFSVSTPALDYLRYWNWTPGISSRETSLRTVFFFRIVIFFPKASYCTVSLSSITSRWSSFTSATSSNLNVSILLTVGRAAFVFYLTGERSGDFASGSAFSQRSSTLSPVLSSETHEISSSPSESDEDSKFDSGCS